MERDSLSHQLTPYKMKYIGWNSSVKCMAGLDHYKSLCGSCESSDQRNPPCVVVV